MQWYFEVLRPPDGEAPLTIREQWVGAWFPIEPRNMDGPQPEIAEGIFSHSRTEMPDAVYVHLSNAIHRSAPVRRSAYSRRVVDDVVGGARPLQ